MTEPRYTEKLRRGDDVFTVMDFKLMCARHELIDYDGFGHPVKRRKCDPEITVKPSKIDEIPADATHVVWYNR